MAMARRGTTVISLAVSAGLVAMLFRIASPAEVARLAAGVDPAGGAVYAGLSVAVLLLRAARYRLLLRGGVGLGNLFWVSAVRGAFVDLLPARAGALSYVVLLYRRFGVPLAAGTGTMLLASLFDYLVFAPLLAGAILFSAGAGIPAGPLALAAFLLLAISGALVAGLPWLLASARRVAARPRFAEGSRPARWAASLAEGIGAMEHDLADLGTVPGYRARMLSLSFAIRLGKYLTIWAGLRAVLSGSGLAMPSFAHVLLGSAGAELSSALPVHAPAGLGTWDAAWTLSFTALGHDPAALAAAGLALHVVSKVLEFSLAALGVLALFLRRR